MVDEVLFDIIKKYKLTQKEKQNPTEMQEFVFDNWLEKLIKKHGLYKVIRGYIIYNIISHIKSNHNVDNIRISVQQFSGNFHIYFFWGEYPQPIFGNIIEFSDKGRTIEEVSALVKLIDNEINTGLKDV